MRNDLQAATQIYETVVLQRMVFEIDLSKALEVCNPINLK